MNYVAKRSNWIFNLNILYFVILLFFNNTAESIVGIFLVFSLLSFPLIYIMTLLKFKFKKFEQNKEYCIKSVVSFVFLGLSIFFYFKVLPQFSTESFLNVLFTILLTGAINWLIIESLYNLIYLIKQCINKGKTDPENDELENKKKSKNVLQSLLDFIYNVFFLGLFGVYIYSIQSLYFEQANWKEPVLYLYIFILIIFSLALLYLEEENFEKDPVGFLNKIWLVIKQIPKVVIIGITTLLVTYGLGLFDNEIWEFAILVIGYIFVLLTPKNLGGLINKRSLETTSKEYTQVEWNVAGHRTKITLLIVSIYIGSNITLNIPWAQVLKELTGLIQMILESFGSESLFFTPEPLTGYQEIFGLGLGTVIISTIVFRLIFSLTKWIAEDSFKNIKKPDI